MASYGELLQKRLEALRFAEFAVKQLQANFTVSVDFSNDFISRVDEEIEKVKKRIEGAKKYMID